MTVLLSTKNSEQKPGFLKTLALAWQDPDLRGKMLLTAALLLLYRLGCYIPVPGVPYGQIGALSASSTVMALMNIFSGNALSRLSVFSLGIMPYITAQIVFQLLQYVLPSVEQWYKDGDAGQMKLIQATRYLGLVLAAFSAIGYTILFVNTYGIQFSGKGLPGGVWFAYGAVVVSMVAGEALIMWFGEVITQRGVGNGMSLIIFVNVLASFPTAIMSSIQTSRYGVGWTIVIFIIMLACIPLITHVELAQRRIPIQYSKRVEGHRILGAQTTYLPIKVATAGVVPVIFASAILNIPQQLSMFFPDVDILSKISTASSVGPWNWALTFVLIMFFSYFYSLVVFNPGQTAENLQTAGAFIPGVRPGKATETYLWNVLRNVTVPGGLFIAVIAVAPSIVFYFTDNILVQALGGASVLIMIGVALDTMSKLQSQLSQRSYSGMFR